jgi:LDH2 family malate/lactate/ureidoglycolate dehydrogenase
MNVPPADAIRVPVDDLRRLSTSLLLRVGVPEADAAAIASLLIDTDLRGVLSHGTRLVPTYARAFLDGQLNATPRVRVIRDDPVTAVVDGDGGLGHLACIRATELAIAKAGDLGMGAAVSRHHGHFGSAGKYTRLAARQGLIGFCASGHTMEGFPKDSGSWCPLGCPPLSFAFPAGDRGPVHLDMGAALFTQEDFEALFDRAPGAFFKSLGLVAVANLMGGVLAGMMRPELRKANLGFPAAWYGAFVLAIDVERLVPLQAFTAETDRTLEEIRALPPLPGYATYDLPGVPEWERERAWALEGIPLGADHRQGLEELARQLDVAVPWR